MKPALVHWFWEQCNWNTCRKFNLKEIYKDLIVLDLTLYCFKEFFKEKKDTIKYKFGPHEILEMFRVNTYRVKLPDDLHISNKINVSPLHKYYEEDASLRYVSLLYSSLLLLNKYVSLTYKIVTGPLCVSGAYYTWYILVFFRKMKYISLKFDPLYNWINCQFLCFSFTSRAQGIKCHINTLELHFFFR